MSSAGKLARERTYRRDGGRCVLCGERSVLTVHHIRPRVLNGPSHSNNLITVCRSCHNSIEAGPRLVALLPAYIIWLIVGPLLRFARFLAPFRWRLKSRSQ